MRDRYKFVEKDGLYFLTSTIVEWLPVFTSRPYFEIVVDSLKYCIKNMALNLFAYVILDNHFHLIASAPELSKAVASLKKFTARNIIKKLETDDQHWLLNQLAFYKKRYKKVSDHQIWQEGAHPEFVSSNDMLIQKIEYIHNNPVKRGLVDVPEHWCFSSARNYILDDHSVIEVDCSLF